MIIDLTVESPRGSRNEYSIDRETGRVHLQRTLLTDMVFPADCGYLDYTLGTNGEPLTALVLLEESTFPGVAVTVRPVGVLRLTRAAGVENTIITVPAQDPHWAATLEITDIAAHTRQSLQHFFQNYTDPGFGSAVPSDPGSDTGSAMSSDIGSGAADADTTGTGDTVSGGSGPNDIVTAAEFGSRDEAERLFTTALNAFRSYDNYES